MKTYLPLFWAVLLVGCKAMMLNKEQITNPKIESRNSIVEFVKKFDLDTTNIYILPDTAIFNRHLKNGVAVPNAYFFNRNNEFISYQKTAQDCNAHIGPFLTSIDSISNLKASSSLTLQKFVADFISIDSHKKIAPDYAEKYDITIVVTSAKYLGMLNKEKVFEWEEIVNKLRASGHKIRYYKLFYDYMDFWGVKKDDMFKIR